MKIKKKNERGQGDVSGVEDANKEEQIVYE